VQTKEQQIAEITNGSLSMDDETPYDLKVRVFGNTAVVNGRLTLAENRKGKKNKFDVLFTDVWIKADGRWQVVLYQGTRLPSPALASIASDTKQENLGTPAETSAIGDSDVADVKATLAALIKLQLQYHAKAVDKLLDPEFFYVSNDGSVVSRTELINLTDREKNPLDTLEVTDVQVRASGDTAVATGIIHEKGLLYGKPYEFRGRMLIAYAKRNGRWLCLAIHD
jgi:ketosteroid isomerase-like protein